MIDISLVKEADEKRELSQVGHHLSDNNLTDVFTKVKILMCGRTAPMLYEMRVSNNW